MTTIFTRVGLLSVFALVSGCSPTPAPLHSPAAGASPTGTLSLVSKQGQHCNITYGDLKETSTVAGIIVNTNDQWIVLKDVDSNQTINDVRELQEVWIPTQKVLSVSFDPVLPGQKQ